MEEEDGEEDTDQEERESVGKDVLRECPFLMELNNTKVPPDQPGHIARSGKDGVDVGEPPTETHTGVLTAAANVQSGESEEGDSGEDNEGGLSVEDLQGGFISEVQSGEEGEDELGQK